MCNKLKQYICGLLFCISINAYTVQVSSLYSAAPPLLSKISDPLVMFVMSVHHELFIKAYGDYSNLSGDEKLETTYDDEFDYYGYFDNKWCYSYGAAKFSPESKASGANNHFCTTTAGPWSGNFLNWSTMTRMDVLRKTLYGGKRSTDTTSQTVLERAFLPPDIHSFAKVYRATAAVPSLNVSPYDIAAFTMCNLTEAIDAAPKMRVADGAWGSWALTEVTQCQWGAVGTPPSADSLGTLNISVEVCVTGKDAEGSDNCKAYHGSGNHYKPIGLLQRYGDSGSIRFGLISGSFQRNISGGVLRKNISLLAGNVDSTKDEVNLKTGVFNSNAGARGIISNINSFKISGYVFGSAYVKCHKPTVSSLLLSTSRSSYSSSHCGDWGNPLAEMYSEALRYFSGETIPTSEYSAPEDTSSHLLGSNIPSWINPQNRLNECANCLIIILSAGLNSFDTDALASVSGINGITDLAEVNSLTDQVGEMEAVLNSRIEFPGDFIVEKPEGDVQCEKASIAKMSDIRGICPELPEYQGGYHVAGLAYHARQNDLRSDLAGKQTIKTYAVQLAEDIPSFSLDVGGMPLTFQPFCRARSKTNGCSLVGINVDSQSDDKKTGRFTFSWDGYIFGSDRDYDASSFIEYCIGSGCTPSIADSQVRISTGQVGKYASDETWYSYTISGTDKDGAVLPFATDTGSSLRQGAGVIQSTTFTATGNSVAILPKPMWLAAKYGGFNDLDRDGSPGYDFNGDGVPDLDDNREWDNRNNITGSLGADGLPDNYFSAINPASLELQLGNLFINIVSRTGSSRGVSLGTNSKGNSSIYQASYQPELHQNGGKNISWGGNLNSLFIDENGWLREDSNNNRLLDDYAIDRVVEMVPGVNIGEAKIQRFTVVNGKKVIDGGLVPLHRLNTLWNARDTLSNTANKATQRTYNALASGGRYITTWLDSNNNNIVDLGEVKPFIAATFNGKQGYLGAANSNHASRIVNYIRGEEITGFRSRVIDYDFDGVDETWILGDIINSTPAVIDPPSANYDLIHDDTSYNVFKEKYQDRRSIVIVGANDGMIHAFNAGFWDNSKSGFNLVGSNSETAHPLGYELWAYAPMNLLPHLRWLTEPDYPHVYYMDGDAKSYDVNIFTADTDHPGGWGTILVMGMGFGGGAIDVTAESHNRTMRSAYVVLDITNPEKPPVLLAEITSPSLGFSMSIPALVKRRVAGPGNNWNSPLENNWYLALASGPAGSDDVKLRMALTDGTSDQNLQVFIYDLNAKQFVTGFDPFEAPNLKSYGGDMVTVDWDKDYKDDSVYFGTVDTSSPVLSGSLQRLRLNSTISSSSVSSFLNTDRPIVSAPTTFIDKSEYWVYSGTGRLLVSSDNRSSSKNSFYGVKEPVNSSGNQIYGSINAGSLIDTTGVIVLKSGDLKVINGPSFGPMRIDGNVINNFTDLELEMVNQPGWKYDLASIGITPSGKSISPAKHFFSNVVFTEYLPPKDKCEIDGYSYLVALNHQTGTATPDALLGFSKFYDEGDYALYKTNLGLGYSSSPTMHYGLLGEASLITQGAGGTVNSIAVTYPFTAKGGRQTWRQLFDIP